MGGSRVVEEVEGGNMIEIKSKNFISIPNVFITHLPGILLDIGISE